ncbi:MAG: hypothetical protein K5695_02015 [Oscillospiraceae bacterium]|nr:hypothetical protein [Oscillospiraceae bacterium]
MYVIVYDFGTSAVKTCLFEISSTIRLICHANATYGLYILENGGAEQDTEEWWEAIAKTTKALFNQTDIKPSEIAGISFCTQMQGVVLVDRHGNALRRPMSYLDTRAVNEFKQGLGKGLIKVSGCNVFKLLRNLYINKTASMSVKDPVYKYKWVERNSLTCQTGSNTMPANCTRGLHFFTYDDAMDIADEAYAFNNKEGGIYLFWKDDAKAYAAASAFTTGQLALAGIGGLAVGILGATAVMMLRKKRQDEKAPTAA